MSDQQVLGFIVLAITAAVWFGGRYLIRRGECRLQMPPDWVERQRKREGR